MTRYGFYINTSRAPFVVQIFSGAKLYETRTRNMLRSLIGKTVCIIETGHGHPIIVGRATISGAELVPYSDSAKRRQARIIGTPYDIKPDGAKWFYKLDNVERLTPSPLPVTRENHGRSWTAWEE